MVFQNDARQMLAVPRNQRPARLPVYEHIISPLITEKGLRFRSSARGYALDSGNSISDYVPVEGYRAMIEAAQKIRMEEWP